MINAIEANGIQPVIGQTFALDALGEAFRSRKQGAHVGKVVVDI